MFYVPGILAIVWGGREREENSKARTGFICGVIGTAISVLGTILIVAVLASAGNAIDDAVNDAESPGLTTPETAPAATTPAASPQTTTVTQPATGPKSTFTDGTYRVVTDIAPGTYRAPGGRLGYWERQSAFGSTALEGIIANDLSTGGQVLVTIAPSDKGFKTSGCGQWTAA